MCQKHSSETCVHGVLYKHKIYVQKLLLNPKRTHKHTRSLRLSSLRSAFVQCVKKLRKLIRIELNALITCLSKSLELFQSVQSVAEKWTNAQMIHIAQFLQWLIEIDLQPTRFLSIAISTYISLPLPDRHAFHICVSFPIRDTVHLHKFQTTSGVVLRLRTWINKINTTILAHWVHGCNYVTQFGVQIKLTIESLWFVFVIHPVSLQCISV